MIVAAYRLILPPVARPSPSYFGCLNVHASLLPPAARGRTRGAGPHGR